MIETILIGFGAFIICCTIIQLQEDMKVLKRRITELEKK